MNKPPLIPTLIVLFFVILMTNLGFWQLNRAQEKQEILKLLANDHVTQIKSANQIKELPKYANVRLTGHFLKTPQLILDNQINNQVVGYHVFTPFLLDGLNTTIMVNRGWLAKNSFSNALLTVETTHVEISGKLNSPPQVGMQLGEIELNDNMPYQIITYFDKPKVAKFLHEKLCSGLSCKISNKVLWLKQSESQGFKRDWKPIIMPPSKHIGYAVQWFSMTVVLIFIFIYWLMKS